LAKRQILHSTATADTTSRGRLLILARYYGEREILYTEA
jgi:hypothetical protein